MELFVDELLPLDSEDEVVSDWLSETRSYSKAI